MPMSIQDTLLLDPHQVMDRITTRTRAVIAVDYAGQPCDYDRLREITHDRGLSLVADASHALGAEYHGRKVGTLADLTVFSFHPVKHLTTGEGGMITTDSSELSERLKSFRNHGIDADYRQRQKQSSWIYDVADLGYNYRLTDLQCALGLSQLRRLPGFLDRRRDIARQYDRAFADADGIVPLALAADVRHAYHLYVVQIDFQSMGTDRAAVFQSLRDQGLGVNVHYIPVHFHSLYRRRLGTGPGLCPVAEAAYERILSLPMFPDMTDDDVRTVVEILTQTIHK